MPTFNLDVIYGAVGETIEDWTATVEQVVALDPPHVSAYGLTVEAGTPLAAAARPAARRRRSGRQVRDRRRTARRAGLANYEVSNWARPGHESRHNFLYWRQDDYRGFGCAAHSHEQGRRWWNVRTPDRYIELIDAGRSAESSAEVLDDEARRVEGLQLMLRTRDGVAADSFDADTLDLLEPMLADRSAITRAGRLLANASRSPPLSQRGLRHASG